MNKVMKNLIIKKDGVYCSNMDRHLKKRLVSVSKLGKTHKQLKKSILSIKDLETVQKKGYATIPIEIEGMGVGFFKCTLEVEKFIMNKMKEKREKNNNNINQRTNFKDNLAVEIKEIPTQSKYDDYKNGYHTYGEYKER